MAMIETAHTAPFGAITIFRVVVEPLSRVSAWIRERREAAHTARVLSRLTARQLEDIGLTMGDVERFRTQSSFL